MNGNEIDYAALFEDEGASEAAEEVAGSEGTIIGDGEEGTGDPAESPAERSEDNPAELPDGEDAAQRASQQTSTADNNGGEGAGAEAVQSPEENARYAAARREAERQRDEALAQRDREHQAFVNRIFADLGLTNPYTGKPITSREEYDVYAQAMANEQRRQFMQQYNLTDAQYSELVSKLPEVREARAAKVRAEEAERQASDARSRAALEAQIKEIGKLDPTIRTAGDLIRHASYPKVYEMVKRGYSASDAFRLANMDTLTARTAAAARQQTINNQAGKEHLMQVSPRGTGAIPVPADVKEQYRMLNPDMSDAEIAKDYAKYIAQTKNSK